MAEVRKRNVSEDELKFMKFAEETSDLKDLTVSEEVPSYQSYPSAVLRGIAKGIKNIGQSFGDPRGLMIGEMGEELPTEEALKSYDTLKQEQSRSMQEALEKRLPIGENIGPRMLESSVSEGVEAIPTAFLGPESTILRSVIGGASAEAAKAAGAPDWAQTGIKIGAQVSPDLKKVLVKRGFSSAAAEERSLIEEARRIGMAEEDIALTQNQRGIGKDILQTVSTKGGRVAQRFDRTKKALGDVWENLRGSPKAQAVLNPEAKKDLIANIARQTERLPAEQLKLISNDVETLIRSNMQGTDIIDFWQKLNYNISKGEGSLGIFKPHLQEALNSISPELGKDFSITNQLYGNYFKLSSRLKPDIAEKIISAGEAGALLHGIVTGNYTQIAAVIGTRAAREMSSELVTNPRFMNLGSKMINALEKGSPQIAKKVYDQIVSEVKKTNADASMIMSEADFEKFAKALSKKKSKKNEK